MRVRVLEQIFVCVCVWKREREGERDSVFLSPFSVSLSLLFCLSDFSVFLSPFLSLSLLFLSFALLFMSFSLTFCLSLYHCVFISLSFCLSLCLFCPSHSFFYFSVFLYCFRSVFPFLLCLSVRLPIYLLSFYFSVFLSFVHINPLSNIVRKYFWMKVTNALA